MNEVNEASPATIGSGLERRVRRKRLEVFMQKETATVYRAAGRRWLTKRAAGQAEARAKIRQRCECERGDVDVPGYTCHYHNDHGRYMKILRRLGKMYERVDA